MPPLGLYVVHMTSSITLITSSIHTHIHTYVGSIEQVEGCRYRDDYWEHYVWLRVRRFDTTHTVTLSTTLCQIMRQIRPHLCQIMCQIRSDPRKALERDQHMIEEMLKSTQELSEERPLSTD